MKPYKQLASEQRYQIYGLKQAGLDQSQIAFHLGGNKSTISRELSRYRGQRGWRPKQARSENSNGLLRQYFPKRMDLNNISEEQVQRAVDRLNHRPRKEQGYRSPHEVFFATKVSYTKPPLAVALQS